MARGGSRKGPRVRERQIPGQGPAFPNLQPGCAAANELQLVCEQEPLAMGAVKWCRQAAVRTNACSMFTSLGAAVLRKLQLCILCSCVDLLTK